MEEIIVTNEVNVTFTNKALNSATKKIVTLVNKTKKSLIEIATILNTVYENKSYKDDGFENIAEYTEKCFGFKKVFTYNLININKFIGDDGECLIPNGHFTEYNASQLQELIPLSLNIVSELAETEEITPLMTTKEIREVVKNYKHSKEEDSVEIEANGSDAIRTIDKIITRAEYRKESCSDGTVFYYINTGTEHKFETFENAINYLASL